jgi:hypothetical protein
MPGSGRSPAPIRMLLRLFPAAHLVVSVLFVLAALGLLCFAGYELWQVVAPGESAVQMRLGHVLDAIALVTIAVASLELGQTIVEEEVQREAHMSAPTRVRRFLSRFFVVIIVSLAVEGLVGTFRAIHEDMTQLVYAGAALIATAALLAGWGVFVHLNRSAEELEPDAMAQAKREDHKVQ